MPPYVESDDQNPSSGDQADSASKSDPSTDSDAEILEVARRRFALAEESESEFRVNAIDDMQFRAGKQWPDQIVKDRQADQRPCLTVNKIPQFVNQITNDQRQNRPAIIVSPVDDGADVETAKIFQGIIRHIERASDADSAYDRAFEDSVSTGLGYFRIVNEFVHPMSFRQEPRIKLIKNPRSVYVDPFYQQPDGSDINWGFVFEDLSHDDYKAQYPNSKLCGADWAQGTGDQLPDWVTNDGVRVAEYFYKTFRETEIIQLSDGQVVEVKDLPREMPQGLTTVGQPRKTVLPAIKWCKMNGHEILEQTDWPGRWIPIIPVLGTDLVVEGKRILEGIIRHAKDPQRMLNYWVSAETETIALAPKAPFIGAEGQFEGHEEQWRTANTRNHPFLQYKPTTIAGLPAPAPTRNVYEAPVQAITNARMLASDDLKGTTGIYDASLGNQSNEKSGVAIDRRNKQTQTSNFHYVDNLSKSIRHGGRQLTDLIPKTFNGPQAARIVAEDGSTDIVQINKLFGPAGQQKIYRLDVGTYDVTVSTGPSYATKRLEASASMADMVRAYPALMQIAGDLLVDNLDWPGAKQLAERIKKTLPPGLADEKDKKKATVPPEAQAQMQQMGQMIDQLTQQLNAAKDQLDSKQMELDSKERIALIDAETKIKVEMLKVDSNEAIVALQEELAHLHRRYEALTPEHEIDPMAAGGEPLAPDQQQLTGELPPGTHMETP